MKRKPGDYMILGLKGMAMGAADIIPGVSGGTIAFITGIYQELIFSIKSIDANLLKILFRQGIGAAWNHINGWFLATVFGGIIISVFSLARLLSWLLHHYPMLVWAFFFGLIVGSAIFVLKKITSWNILAFVMLALGTAIAFYITIASPASSSEALWFVFISGVIAICAMILPGISGSFILLLMGKYAFILQAVKTFNIPVLLSFALGCLIGIISFSNVISWLFKKYPNATMALLSGFMIGSLNKLWPWKEVTEYSLSSHGELIPLVEKSIGPGQYQTIFAGDPMVLPVMLCALAGLIIIFLFERLDKTGKEV